MNVVSSAIDICNMALDEIGVRNITSLDEDTKQAKKCKLWYDIVRKRLLINLNASFSIARTTLAEDVNQRPINQWKHSYCLPNDCLLVLEVDEKPIEKDICQIEGKYLLSDKEKVVYIRYIKDVEDVSLYDAEFCNLLSLKLAEKLCMSLTEDEQKMANIRALAQQEYVNTSTKYGHDNKITVVNKSRFRRARHTSGIIQY